MKQLMVCLFLSLMFFVCFTSNIYAQSSSILHWFHPYMHVGSNWSEIFSSEDNWKETLKRTDVFGIWMEAVELEGDNFLAYLVPLLSKYHVPLGLESAANNIWIPCDSDRGRNSGVREINVIRKIEQYGGQVSYISIDDVLAHTVRGMHPYQNIDSRPCFFSKDEAISQLISYMKTVHAQYPQIQIGYISNFPNRMYNGIPSYWGPQPDPTVTVVDSKQIYEEMLTRIEQSGEALKFFHIDSPYDFTTGQFPSPFTQVSSINWLQRILDIKNQVKNHGLRFGIIFNSQRGGQGTDGLSGNDQEYYEDTMAYLSLVTNNGGLPDNVIIESWYTNHPALLPDSQQYTLTHIATEVFPIRVIEGDANGDGEVDGADYTIWLNNYGQAVSGPSHGDFNNNGEVDGSDYIRWLNNYNI